MLGACKYEIVGSNGTCFCLKKFKENDGFIF